MLTVEPSLPMWFTLALTAAAIVAYALELPAGRADRARHPRPAAAAVPARAPARPRRRGARTGRDPGGFASPALIAVSALLVVGEAMVTTGALEGIARLLVWLARGSFKRALIYSLGYVTASSGFLNNTPIVVIFMPILRSIAERFGRSASRRDDAAELRRDPRRHADADRHLDQPPGLGRARQARRAAARLLRLHAARRWSWRLPAAPT